MSVSNISGCAWAQRQCEWLYQRAIKNCFWALPDVSWETLISLFKIFPLPVVLHHPFPQDNYPQNLMPNTSSQCRQNTFLLFNSRIHYNVAEWIFFSHFVKWIWHLIFNTDLTETSGINEFKVFVDLASMNFKAILNFPLMLKKRMGNHFGSSKTTQMRVSCCGLSSSDRKLLSTNLWQRLHALSLSPATYIQNMHYHSL